MNKLVATSFLLAAFVASAAQGANNPKKCYASAPGKTCLAKSEVTDATIKALFKSDDNPCFPKYSGNIEDKALVNIVLLNYDVIINQCFPRNCTLHGIGCKDLTLYVQLPI